MASEFQIFHLLSFKKFAWTVIMEMEFYIISLVS